MFGKLFAVFVGNVTLEVEFEPVPVGFPNDAKGWQDRDRLAVWLEGVARTEIVHSYPPPSGWLHAIDEALVTAHIGVANAHDTYEQAKAKLDNLIGFHVDVATDPAVNGGWKLMPVEPTKEIYECFTAYDGTMYSNPFNFDNFSVDYAFALEAAPETKP